MGSKMGRHKKEEYDVKKNKLTIRLSDGEKVMIQDLATMHKMSISDYIRKLVFIDYQADLF